MDGRLTPDERKEYLYLGKKLRSELINLLTAIFEDGTPAVIDANAAIAKLNKSLKNTADVIEKTEKTVGQLGELVSLLDKVLKAASSFI
jgi:hypothetical protein